MPATPDPAAGRRASLAKGGGAATSTALTRGATRGTAPRTRVVLVRQPVKSVRPMDHPDRAPFALALAAIATAGGVGAVWLLGHLGFRLGWATLVRLPGLSDDPFGALATGVLLLLSLPHAVITAGLAGPEMLMLGFALIAVPAAALGAAKPRTPGGPRPAPVVTFFATFAAALAGVNAMAVVAWVVSPQRLARLGELPLLPEDVTGWGADLEVAAGLDTLVFAAAVLWVVLIFRLPVVRWLRVLAAVAAIFALAVITVALAASAAAAVQARTPRPVAHAADSGPIEGRLLLGTVAGRPALLSVEERVVVIDLPADRPDLTVFRMQSLVEFVGETVVEEE